MSTVYIPNRRNHGELQVTQSQESENELLMEQMKQMKIQKKKKQLGIRTDNCCHIFPGQNNHSIGKQKKKKKKNKTERKKRKFTDRSDYLRLAVVEELAAHHPMGY